MSTDDVPELIIEERPPRPRLSQPVKLRSRELFYKVLGDYSRRVTSLSDEDLIEEVRLFVRDYR